MRKKIFQTAIKIFLVSFVLVTTVFNISAPSAKADSFTNMLDKQTRLKKGQTSAHTFNFNLPAGIDWDSTGNTDDIIIDFSTDFSMVTGWDTFGFFLGDIEGGMGAMVTVYDVNEAAGSLTYPSCVGAGLNDTVVAVDTTNMDFGFRRCTGGSDTGSGMAWTFYTWTGAMTNPAAAGTQEINLSITDEGVADAHGGTLAVGIVDDDQVQVTATVDPTLTFDIDTTTVAMPGGETAPPYTVDFNPLNLGVVNTSNNSSINSIYLDFQTNATGGGTVTVADENAGLTSIAASKTITSASGLLVAGTEGYGICYSNVANLDTTYPTYYTGNCTPTKHTVGALQTSPQNLIGTSGPNTPGRVEVLVKVAISAITPAAGDYEDTLTFIATGTF